MHSDIDLDDATKSQGLRIRGNGKTIMLGRDRRRQDDSVTGNGSTRADDGGKHHKTIPHHFHGGT
jgi:hypothetical protein